jgi:hypothetical protein
MWRMHRTVDAPRPSTRSRGASPAPPAAPDARPRTSSDLPAQKTVTGVATHHRWRCTRQCPHRCRRRAGPVRRAVNERGPAFSSIAFSTCSLLARSLPIVVVVPPPDHPSCGVGASRRPSTKRRRRPGQLPDEANKSAAPPSLPAPGHARPFPPTSLLRGPPTRTRVHQRLQRSMSFTVRSSPNPTLPVGALATVGHAPARASAAAPSPSPSPRRLPNRCATASPAAKCPPPAGSRSRPSVPCPALLSTTLLVRSSATSSSALDDRVRKSLQRLAGNSDLVPERSAPIFIGIARRNPSCAASI